MPRSGAIAMAKIAARARGLSARYFAAAECQLNGLAD